MLIGMLACSLELLNAVLVCKLPFLKSSQCGTEPVGIAFGRLVACSGEKSSNRQTERQTGMTEQVLLPFLGMCAKG